MMLSYHFPFCNALMMGVLYYPPCFITFVSLFLCFISTEFQNRRKHFSLEEFLLDFCKSTNTKHLDRTVCAIISRMPFCDILSTYIYTLVILISKRYEGTEGIESYGKLPIQSSWYKSQKLKTELWRLP